MNKNETADLHQSDTKNLQPSKAAMIFVESASQGTPQSKQSL